MEAARAQGIDPDVRVFPSGAGHADLNRESIEGATGA